MRLEDFPKTAFSTPYGHYEYTRMPFGFKNAFSTFQRFINSVLTGLQGLQCFVYLDNIVIYAGSISEHSQKLEGHKTTSLLLQPDKCKFMLEKSHIWVKWLVKMMFFQTPKK